MGNPCQISEVSKIQTEYAAEIGWQRYVRSSSLSTLQLGYMCYMCLSVCVCPHDKTKTAESTITKLGTIIVHSIAIPRSSINIRSKGQRSRSQGQKVRKGDRVAGVSCAQPLVSTILSYSSLYVIHIIGELKMHNAAHGLGLRWRCWDSWWEH